MEDGKTATIAQTIEGSKEDGEKRFADFSDLKDGGILWRASLVLLHYLEKNALSDLKGKRVIELGSGEPAEKRSHASLFYLGPDLKLLRQTLATRTQNLPSDCTRYSATHHLAAIALSMLHHSNLCRFLV